MQRLNVSEYCVGVQRDPQYSVDINIPYFSTRWEFFFDLKTMR